MNSKIDLHVTLNTALRNLYKCSRLAKVFFLVILYYVTRCHLFLLLFHCIICILKKNKKQKKLNETKTKSMLVTGKRLAKKMEQSTLQLHVNSTEIEQVSSH